MTHHLLYTVLGYRHSHISNEQVNVGVLVIFPENGELYFLLPSKTALGKRLRHLYPDAAADTVWGYLRSFEKRAESICGKLNSYLGNFSDLVSDQFLTDNGSSLQFGELETTPFWKGREESLALLERRFLSGYATQHAEHTEVVHNDAYIARQVKQLIREAFSKRRDRDYQLYLKDEHKEIQDGAAKIVAEQYWQNGTTNLIHPLSLDVKTGETIASKCFYLSKSAELLQRKAEEGNFCFHFVLSKPQEKNLQSIYEKSVEVLEATNKNTVKVIRPEGLEKYAKKVATDAVVLDESVSS